MSTKDTIDLLDKLLNTPLLVNYGVSPDKKWLVWSWGNIGPAVQVYLSSLEDPEKVFAIPASEENNWFISWGKDSKSFLIAQDTGGDERVQVFQIKVTDPNTKIPLTDKSPNYFLRGANLHPNNHWLIYGANFDFEKEEIEQTLIIRQDLNTGERKVLARPLKPAYCEPELNLEGTYIIYARKDLNPGGRQIWLVDIEGKEDKEVLNFGAKNKVYATWVPNQPKLIFIVEEENFRKVGIYNIEDNSTQWLLDDKSRNIEEVFVPVGSNFAVLIEESEAKTKATLINLDTKREETLPNFQGDLKPIVPIDENIWIGEYSHSQTPPDLITFNLNNPDPVDFKSLTNFWQRSDLNPEQLVAAEDFRWRSVDGLEIQGWLYKTKITPKGTIVLVHGGPTTHSKNAYKPQIQFLVSAGFNVLDPNYRGSTGFGLEFQELIKKTFWGGLEQEDIKTGIEALIEKGIAEKGKVGITGTSYGGYSAWFAITHFPKELITAAAPICGMTDLVVDYETTRPDLRPYSEEMLGGSPAEVPEIYKKRSPINFLQNIKGGLLIIQGLRDPNVTPQNVEEVEKRLKELSIPFGKLVFEDEGHGIGKPKNKTILYKRLADFFTKAF